MLTTSTLIAMILYLAAAFIQWRKLNGLSKAPSLIIKLLAALGMLFHTFSVYSVLHQPDGINLGFFIAGSFVGWLVTAVVLFSSFRQPIENIFIGILPMVAVTAGLSVWGPHLGIAKFYAGGLIIHILLSILAYSIFTVATFQAFLLSKQHTALKQHATRGLVASLPPIQTMETLLFEMIWVGMILLTTALASGFIFVDNLFAQHLIHKTLLSLLAWALYAVLLWGRTVLGWRSQKAVRWTVSGFVVLMLGFFGSKLVLDLMGN